MKTRELTGKESAIHIVKQPSAYVTLPEVMIATINAIIPESIVRATAFEEDCAENAPPAHFLRKSEINLVFPAYTTFVSLLLESLRSSATSPVSETFLR